MEPCRPGILGSPGRHVNPVVGARGDRRPLQGFQMVLNLTSGHPMRIERQHLVVNAVEPPLPFLAHRGFKRASSIVQVAQRTGDQPRVTEGTHWGMGGE